MATMTSRVELRKTELFDRWLNKLKDIRARARILVRLERLAEGHAGDTKPVGHGVLEMRVDYGPGYRMYYIERERDVIILLAGGDKRTQSADIRIALRLAHNL